MVTYKLSQIDMFDLCLPKHVWAKSASARFGPGMERASFHVSNPGFHNKSSAWSFPNPASRSSSWILGGGGGFTPSPTSGHSSSVGALLYSYNLYVLFAAIAQ